MSQQQACLPVSKRRKFHSAEAISFEDVESMNAMEYLSRVSHQAHALPEYKTAGAQAQTRISHREHQIPIDGLGTSLSYLISERTLVRPPPSAAFLPTKDPERWVDRTLEEFSRLRDYLERCSQNGVGGKDTNRLPVPPMKDRPAWHIFCVGVDDARGNEGSYFHDEEMQEETAADQEPPWKKSLPKHGYNNPDVSLLLQLDQVMVRSVLGHLAYYITEGWSPFNMQRSSWIYALLARLERPIHRDDASILYGLLKSLCQVRAEMNLEGDNIADARTHLARVNVLIAIIGVYFEQGGGFSGVMTVK